MTTPAYALQTLALLDPEYPGFAAGLPPEWERTARALPPGLADDVCTLLRAERPELGPWLDAQASAAPPDKQFVDPLAAVGLLAAILFVLRTHIKIDGKHFHFEHEPMPNELLQKVLDTLSALLSGKQPD